MIDEAIVELQPLIGIRAACRATGRAQANHYRRHRKSPAPVRPVRQPRRQPRALSQAERDTVRALLNSPDFVDKAPATVYHELLDEGVYLASVSSMYRILRAHGEVRERRREAVHPARVKPELVATKPNVCWSWDITKLHGPAKWSYFYLYVIIDIYSRYTVGWLIAERESAALAEQLLADTIAKQNIDRDTLSIHADNGSSMASKPVAFLLADLGVTKTHSRPHTSNDNPYSEAQFRTLKYRPRVPPHVRQSARCPSVLPTLLPLVQRRTPALRHRLAHPSRCPLWTRRDGPHGPRRRTVRRLHPKPGPVRTQAPPAATAPHRRMDQQTARARPAASG